MAEQTLSGRTIALLATNGFEDSELTKPMEAVEAAGGNVVVVSDETDTIKGEKGTEITVDNQISSVVADDFHGLLLPGGTKNPDKLRMNTEAVAFVRSFFSQHKPVAAICHAPWLLVEADVVDSRTLTSRPSLKTDIQNAGGTWVDEEVVTDQGLVTSRNPDDLPAFCDKAIEEFAEGKYQEQTV